MKTQEKKKVGVSIADALKDIKGRFGNDAVMTLDQAAMDVETISTGSFGLDLALGVGGLPLGRITEVYGPEASGKTTLALHAVAEAQKIGGVCAYIDTEHALDPLYASKLGVDTKSLLISQPENGEQAFSIVESMVLTGKFSIIVIDSVASLVPKAEVEGEMGDPQVGRHAKLMSHGIRKLVPIISNSNTVVIFINQIRYSINVMPGQSPEFTTGGKALKFYSSVRLDIRRIAQIKKGEEIVGGRTRVKVVKNKVAPPYKQTEFDILYGEGISHEGEILALGEKYKIIKKSGNTYSWDELKLGVGYDKSRIFLKENPKIMEDIKGLILENFKKPDVSLLEVGEIKEVAE
jgi:recombination protein RecA